MNEKIIQITATSGGEDNICDNLYALTDHGRLFRLVNAQSKDDQKWIELPPVPELQAQ